MMLSEQLQRLQMETYSWKNDKVENRNTCIVDAIWIVLLMEILSFFNNSACAIRYEDERQYEEETNCM